MSNRAAVALGSNLGDRLGHLQQAVAALRAVGQIESISPLYRTAPVGGPAQDDYLNAVVVVGTPLEPGELLDRLLAIEGAASRERAERWGPRTLDLDLITVVDGSGSLFTASSPRLELPHPRAHQRRFVLEPLVTVWPDAPVGEGRPAREYVGGVTDQAVERLGAWWWRAGIFLPSEPASIAFLALQFLLYGLFAWALFRGGEVGGPLRLGSGAAVVAAGAVWTGWAAVSLGASLSPFPSPVPGATLVTIGPYRWMRHPIYAGVLVMLGGLSLAFSALGAAVVVAGSAFFFWIKARYEEVRLEANHPDYAEYSRRVRGRLLPLPPRSPS